MTVQSIHHVSLLTRHNQLNIDFYTKVLGLRMVKNTVNQDNTRMYHYYYGDYAGRPGSVVTFFPVPRLGHRYDNDAYFETVSLQIPEGSLNYWKKRLNHFSVPFTESEHALTLQDPDNVTLILTETATPALEEEFSVKNEIPKEFQITAIQSTELHVANFNQTIQFFESFLDWKNKDGYFYLKNNQWIKILPSNTTENSRNGRGSMDHIAFAVADEEELKQLHEKAKKQGWEIEKLVSRGYFKSLYIREPGGHLRIEFATMNPGFSIDEPLETLGESFALPPFLAPKREEILERLYPFE
ncbi:MAG: VOC family protein [Lactobacillales bacterium]|jgi:catechol 2,3-dioxygenase-like lactoylglutathione lyase family enzyme|nr:VOC family protein [Lactobacillales bacterium]